MDSNAEVVPPASNRPYLHKGQMLSSPPISARIQGFIGSAYVFLALYFTTLFSLDPYAAAEASPFNTKNRSASRSGAPRKLGWGSLGGGSGGGSGGSGPGGPGSGGRKLGRVDDIRGPECKSCQ
ncbi:hypothetical protein B0A49_02925 [Cryomyces minteri]|uniref:Uncharacterized protein n=1 Tax=Cryomyces minteri TaxID=331657 RepID=A0A4U0XMF1_9PEZI|nr:hypothetical protein B0A49_02925 [Cryomyces minteri]